MPMYKVITLPLAVDTNVSLDQMGVSMREKYDLDCDYYMLFIEHNYFIYRITDEMILEIFNEKEDFMRQMFGIVTTSQDTIDYWGEQ